MRTAARFSSAPRSSDDGDALAHVIGGLGNRFRIE
jgi:hypothetical protein